jgi:ADP-ribose pyrophosphatase YjhB (NUDIX family)
MKRQAKEEVRMRASVQRALAVGEKEGREANLRDLAAQARAERGMGGGGKWTKFESDDEDDEDDEDAGVYVGRGLRDSCKKERKSSFDQLLFFTFTSPFLHPLHS